MKMSMNDIISSINPVAMTADDLWAVYTIVKMNNGGVVPMDEVNTEEYNYGVKAEKAKARKSRKARRAEGRHHSHKGWNVDCNRLYNLECKRIAVKKSEKHFKADMALELAEAEAEVAEAEVAEAEAEARAEAERIANMSNAKKVEKRAIIMDALAKKALYLRPYTFETERGKFWFEEVREYGWTDSWLTGVRLSKLTNGNVEPVYTIWQKETDTEEEVKPRSMEEMIEDMVKII